MPCGWLEEHWQLPVLSFLKWGIARCNERLVKTRIQAGSPKSVRGALYRPQACDRTEDHMEQLIRSESPLSTGPQVPILKVSGELDLSVAPQLHNQLQELFVDGATSIYVDLLDASFLDSTALGVMVNALNQSQELGGRLHLIVTEPQILRVLTITGLIDAFILHSSLDELAGCEEES
jgi:anti-sigma B factor antagonist